MSEHENDRAFQRLLVESQAELRRSVYDVHGVVERIDERQTAFIASVDSRMSQHSAQIDSASAKVAAIERNMMYVRAWSAGAGVAVTSILGAILWLLAKVPARAWDVIGR